MSQVTGPSLNAPKAGDVTVLQQHKTTRRENHVNISVSRKCHSELTRIQSQSLLRTKGQVVDYLIQTSQTETPIIPTATLDLVLSDDKPVQLCGGSGEGKTSAVKKWLPNIPCPVFLVDVAGEYDGLRKVSVGDTYSFKWNQADADARYRFVPTNNAQIAASELQTIFSFLNTEKMRRYNPAKVPSGVLSRWIFIIEESHRVAKEPTFLNFLFEARKFTKKIIVVGSDPELFGNVCKLLRSR